jgi:dihydrodipicolinate synthase/N-acetylneuraminate lyase
VDILLYNIPTRVKSNIPADVVRAASGTERIIGIKDSQGDWSLLQTILTQRTRDDFEVLCGSEPMMAAAMLCGADGIVPGSANFAPHLLIELYEAGRAKKVDEAFELQRRVERVRELLFLTGSVFVSMKTACKLLGICSDVTSFAYAPATPEQEEGIRSILEREGLLSKRAPGCA